MNPNMINRNSMGYYGMNRSRTGQRNMNKDCMRNNIGTDNDCSRSDNNNRTDNNFGCMNSQQLMNMNRNQLLRYLNQVSFSMYDTVLFLDTHPCDREAIAYFNEMQQARKCALAIYQQKFGPLLLDDVDADCEWTWGMEPLPWETCNN